eukprot:gene6960-6618_t
MIIRIPVAWFLPGQSLPQPPFPPPPPPVRNPVNCTAFVVAGAPITEVNGHYTLHGARQPDGTYVFQLDAEHQLYHFDELWKLAHMGQGPVYYTSTEDQHG